MHMWLSYGVLRSQREPCSKERQCLVSDHLATVNGMEVGIMLFEAGGNLSSLEVYSCPGTDQPFGLPAINSIRL